MEPMKVEAIEKAGGNSKKRQYVRQVLKAIYEEEALKRMLVEIRDIDYAGIYNSSEESKEVIQVLREKLGKEKSPEAKYELRKELDKFEPSSDIKYIILVEEMLRIADELRLGIGIEENSLFPYFYNGYSWEVIPKSIAKEFIAEAATKSGFNYYDSRIRKNMEALYSQFSSLEILFPPKYDKDVVKINLANGTFVIRKDSQELVSFSKEDFFKYQLPFNYDEKATAPMFEAFLNEVLPEKESQMILAEYLGYVFTRTLKLEKCLVLTGSGSNGKSVIFDIVSALLGEKNVCSYTLNNLCNDSGYFRAGLTNYLLNYSSEMGNKNCNPDTVKKLISNEPIDARSPYGAPFILRDYGKFIFNTNKLPADVEFTNAYFRRFMFLSFDVTIPAEKQDESLAKKIIGEELSGVFNWVLEGLRRLLENRKFTESQKVKETMETFRKEIDSVAMFVEGNSYKPSTTESMILKDLRDIYANYCKENGYIPVGAKEFSSRIEALGFKIQRKATDNKYRIHCENGLEQHLKASEEFALKAYGKGEQG